VVVFVDKCESILEGLTSPQREAVTHVDGPLLVVAGAGSGKTRVITRRVAYLTLQDIPAYRILAVTFTNKASGEMRERIEQLAGTKGAWVSTFHALCAQMLRMSADDVGLPRGYSIYDRTDQLNTVKEALKRLELSTSTLKPASALHAISGAKGELQTPEQFAKTQTGFREEMLAKVYKVYQEILDASGALDFDDLLMKVAKFLESDQAFRERWQRRFHYVLIDEYQDTNRAQYLIARTLAAEHRNICATGDPDQSIYGWRGADIRNILDFTKDYPDARVVRLEQNYRSTKTILRAANSVITKNSERHARGLWTENEDGVAVSFRMGNDAEAEAARVVAELMDQHGQGRPWSDFAIFYRTNAQSRSFEEALLRESVPYQIIAAVEFYKRQEVKDLLSYLQVCVNKRDDLSLQRIINVPTRGIGQRTLNILKQWAAAHEVSLWAALANAEEIEGLKARARKALAAFKELVEGFRAAEPRPVATLCARVLEQSGYGKWLAAPDNEERRENVEQLLGKAALYDELNPEGDLESFLQEVSLVSDVDTMDGEAEAVLLMTLHSAKGLEFPVVFLTGMEEGLLPHQNSSATDTEVEEERRLCYVGITRAKKQLVLSAACRRAQYSAKQFGDDAWSRTPSRFLEELGDDVLDAASRQELTRFASATEATPDDGWGSLSRNRWRAPASQPASSGFKPRAPKPFKPLAPKPARQHELPVGGEATKSITAFAVGDRVRHPQFGDGQITGLQASDKMTLATVSMAMGGKRVFALEFAGLIKL